MFRFCRSFNGDKDLSPKEPRRIFVLFRTFLDISGFIREVSPYCHNHAFTNLQIGACWSREPTTEPRLKPVVDPQRGLLPEETLGVVAAGGLFENHQASVDWLLNSIQPIPNLQLSWSHTRFCGEAGVRVRGDGGVIQSTTHQRVSLKWRVLRRLPP